MRTLVASRKTIHCGYKQSMRMANVDTASIQESPMRKRDCAICHGSGTIECDDCRGVGTIHLPAGTLGEWQILLLPRPCTQCEGDGKIDCPHCQGTGTG